MQKLTKMDQNSTVDDGATMKDLGLGTASFHISRCDDPTQSVPMVINSMANGIHLDPLPADGCNWPLFWLRGNGDQLPNMLWQEIWQ